MPRMITPRRESIPRRSNASLPGSRSSLKSYESRRASLDNNYYGSQFSLRRGSSQSSSSLRQQALLRHHQAMQQQSKQNAVWNMDDQGSVSHPPSLVTTSDTSVETEERSLSRTSSQSSMRPPSPSLLPTTEVRYGALRQYYVTRRATLHHQHPTSSPGSPRNQHGLRRASLQYPTNRSLPGSPRNSFLPQARITEEGTWGQFVDVADAEEELVRRSKLLSITRRYPATLSHSVPSPLR